MADYGLTTLGVKLYGAESTNGAKVSTGASYSQLTRINAMSGIDVTPQSIDVSALEDFDTKRKAGRSDVSETFTITVNGTNETEAEWASILGKKMCFQTVIPGLTKALFVIAEVPSKIPQPSIDQNGNFTFAMPCVVNNFIGFDTAVTVGE